MNMYDAMAKYSMGGFDLATPTTSVGTPANATDSDEFNDSTPRDDHVPSPGTMQSKRNMSNGTSSPQAINGPMNGHGLIPPFFPGANGAMANGAMMVPFPGSTIGGAGIMPMGQQMIVYCVPVEQVPWVQANCRENNNGEVQICSPCSPLVAPWLSECQWPS